MKVRHALVFAILPIMVVLAILQGGTLITRSYMDEASSQASSALRLAVAALAGHLSRYGPLPTLIADHDDIAALPRSPDYPWLRRAAGNYLKEISGLLESSDIYVMPPTATRLPPATTTYRQDSWRHRFQGGYRFHRDVMHGGEYKIFVADPESIISTTEAGNGFVPELYRWMCPDFRACRPCSAMPQPSCPPFPRRRPFTTVNI